MSVPAALRRFALSAWLAGILSLTLCVFVPLTIYSGNTAEFVTPPFAVIGVYLPWAALAVLLAGLVAAFLPEDTAARFASVLAALCVLAWLQANLLVWRYGPLDGRSIDWLSDAWRGVVDGAIWLAVLALAIVGWRRFGRLLAQAAAVTLAIQLFPAALWTADGQSAPVTPAETFDAAAQTALTSFSAERNVLHIVMDGFQSDLFAEIVSDPANAELRAALAGFTYFDDHLGAYPYTQMSIPAFLAGELYRNQQPAEDFVASTLAGPTVLSAAAEAGFDVEVAASVSLSNVYRLAPVDRALGITADLHAGERDYLLNDAARLIDLSLFRSVPHFAKALVHRDELWVFQGMIRDADYLQLQYFADLAFLDELERSMTAGRSEPVYKLLHLMLAHRPTVGSADCVYDGRHATTRPAVRAQARCGLGKVLAVLERMRALDVYDDSLIVLMADHGAWLPLPQFGADGQPDAVTAGMATPLFAVKPPGAQGPLRTSDRPTALTDVPATVAALLGIDTGFPGAAAFAEPFPAERERRFFNYAYGRNPRDEGYLFPMQEYIVRGTATDPSAWRPGPLYAPGSDVR